MFICDVSSIGVGLGTRNVVVVVMFVNNGIISFIRFVLVWCVIEKVMLISRIIVILKNSGSV